MTDSKPTTSNPKDSVSSTRTAIQTSTDADASKSVAKQQGAGVGSKLSGLHARLRNPQVQAASDPLTRPNRIVLMVDCSGSMAGEKIISLRDACVGFVNACDMTDTSIGLEPFPEGSHDSSNRRLPLTTVHPMLMTTCMTLSASGGTPLAQAMQYVINTYPVTRSVIVSDGHPDRAEACYETANTYVDAGVPCDCVHIGDSTHGEEVLRRIAEMTGGQYIKFTDVSAFSKAFKYLSPAFYGTLTSGGLSASSLGAKEIK